MLWQCNGIEIWMLIKGEINMKMDKVAGSGNDEFYTPVYAITPLIKYLKDKGFKKILCPFDTKDSKIYKVLLSEGF